MSPLVGQILGILIAILFGLTISLYFQNRLKPKQEILRIKFHCKLGGLTFFSVIIFVILRLIDGYELNASSFYSIGLLSIIIASGIILNYFPDAGSLRYHSRTLHPVIVFALILSIVFNFISN
ncbi:MAG: hypothetical protein ACXAEX_17950 [Promethearchaeota archaeon]